MDVTHINAEAHALEREWSTDSRWNQVARAYGAEEVVRLRGSLRIRAKPFAFSNSSSHPSGIDATA